MVDDKDIPSMSARQPKPLILEYSKRRFDGGPEIEMIKQIEIQYQLMEQSRHAAIQSAHLPGPVQTPLQPAVPLAHGTTPSGVKKRAKRTASNRLHLLHEEVVVPYIELVLGISGLFVGSFIYTFMMTGGSANPITLKQEQHVLLRHSWLVVGHSLLGILTGPYHLLKILFKK